MARILIVEDEPIIAKDLATFIQSEGHFLVGVVYNGDRALDKIHSSEIDLVLLDINLGGSRSGIDIATILKSKYDIPFIFITSFSDDQTLARALEANPFGYIVKPFEERTLKSTIELALHNASVLKAEKIPSLESVNRKVKLPISPREFEFLVDLSQGLTNAEIAQKHFISVNTIKFHLKKLFQKLDVSSRSAAVEKLLRHK